jgi:hypothetical protein
MKTIGSLSRVAIFAVLLVLAAHADVLILQDNEVVNGKILQEDRNNVSVQFDYGTATYPKAAVRTIEKTDPVASAIRGSTLRIPPWGEIIGAFAKCGWMHSMRQIPATVIDQGALRNVPYISFRSNAGGYQMNVYGDLDKPAGVEIGALNLRLNDVSARSNCVAFISSVLTREDDKRVARALSLERKSLIKKDGFTFEVTLPDEADAYGGWWITVYDEAALDAARANESELKAITQSKVPEKSTVVKAAPAARPAGGNAANALIPSWTPDDLSHAQPSRLGHAGGGGSVYVRGYHRRDGSYVQPHTRRAPRR